MSTTRWREPIAVDLKQKAAAMLVETQLATDLCVQRGYQFERPNSLVGLCFDSLPYRLVQDDTVGLASGKKIPFDLCGPHSGEISCPWLRPRAANRTADVLWNDHPQILFTILERI